MMKHIVFVERRGAPSPSIESIFRQVAELLPSDEFTYEFQKLPYGEGFADLVRNFVAFRPLSADVYHVTGEVNFIALRLPGRRSILTIHDLILLHLRRGFRRWLIKQLYLILPVRHVRSVTAVSDFTRSEIDRFAGAGKSVRVIQNPLPNGFEPEPRRPFNEERPVILHIGTAVNKNLSNLIQALAGIDCVLRIVGTLATETREQLRAADVEFENVVGLDRAEMQNEYRNCDIVAFCSTYEGFGLPILEAQAMEKPLITSDRDPMRSVAGDGAVLVDPDDPNSIRDGVIRLTSDAALRGQIVAAGRINITRFDPGATAAQYTQLYREVART